MGLGGAVLRGGAHLLGVVFKVRCRLGGRFVDTCRAACVLYFGWMEVRLVCQV